MQGFPIYHCFYISACRWRCVCRSQKNHHGFTVVAATPTPWKHPKPCRCLSSDSTCSSLHKNCNLLLSNQIITKQIFNDAHTSPQLILSDIPVYSCERVMIHNCTLQCHPGKDEFLFESASSQGFFLPSLGQFFLTSVASGLLIGHHFECYTSTFVATLIFHKPLYEWTWIERNQSGAVHWGFFSEHSQFVLHILSHKLQFCLCKLKKKKTLT